MSFCAPSLSLSLFSTPVNDVCSPGPLYGLIAHSHRSLVSPTLSDRLGARACARSFSFFSSFFVFTRRFKLVEWNADNKSCRRTTLGPTFGGPVAQLLPLAPERPLPAPPADGASAPPQPPRDAASAALGQASRAAAHSLAAYACAERVVGLVKLPLDGNPAKAMGVVAHPGGVSALAAAHDASLLATAGGADGTVNLWSVHAECVHAADAASCVPLDGEVLSADVPTASLPWVRLLGGAAPGGELDALVCID